MAATLVFPRLPLPCPLFVQRLLLARVGNEPLTLCLLTRELARAPDRLGLFPVFALRRFFIRAPLLRWSRFPGQNGGLAKVDSGFDYAANFSSRACVA